MTIVDALELDVELDHTGARQVRSSVTIGIGARDYRVSAWITLGDGESIGEVGPLSGQGHAVSYFIAHPCSEVPIRVEFERIGQIAPALSIIGAGHVSRCSTIRRGDGRGEVQFNVWQAIDLVAVESGGAAHAADIRVLHDAGEIQVEYIDRTPFAVDFHAVRGIVEENLLPGIIDCLPNVSVDRAETRQLCVERRIREADTHFTEVKPCHRAIAAVAGAEDNKVLVRIEGTCIATID